jgi:tight adherence protein B
LQAQWEDPIADRVFTTLRLAAAIGGSRIDTMLGSLAVSLSDEIRIRKMHRAALSQQQITAGVSLLAPWLILALSVATNPQAAAAFASSTGRSILWLGLAATSLGYLAARRATRLSDPPRLFR